MAISNYEQLMLELINRARGNPAREAAYFGIDLNEGLAAGTIPVSAVQPLAWNEKLSSAAESHNLWMLSENVFSHYEPGGITPFDRMNDVGYDYTFAGENLAWQGSTTSFDITDRTEQLHANLFIDTDVEGRGHRTTIFEPHYREIGIAVDQGPFIYQGTEYNSLMTSHEFGRSLTGPFLTGVAYTDTDNNNFYTPGEGVEKARVLVSTASGEPVTTVDTSSSGGYSLDLDSGTYRVSFVGQDVESRSGIVEIADINVKLDMVTNKTIPVTTPAFNKIEYLSAKLSQLQSNDEEWQHADISSLESGLLEYNLTPETHYLKFGWQEGLAPNQYFDPDQYIANKARQLVDVGLFQDFNAAQNAFTNGWEGDPYQHYLLYGYKEGINPSSAFDQEQYYAAKLTELQGSSSTGTFWHDKDVSILITAFNDLNLSPLQHYYDYGINEGLNFLI